MCAALENDKYFCFKCQSQILLITLATLLLFVVTWKSIALHQREQKTHMFPAISSYICSLPAAHSTLSLSLNQMKASPLQVAADRSSAPARGSHGLTSSLLNLPQRSAYNDPFMLYSCRCCLFAAAKEEKKYRNQQKTQEKGKGGLC